MVFLEAIFTPVLAIISAKILELDTDGVFYLYIGLCVLACILVIPLKVPQDIKKVSTEDIDESVKTNIQ